MKSEFQQEWDYQKNLLTGLEAAILHMFPEIKEYYVKMRCCISETFNGKRVGVAGY